MPCVHKTLLVLARSYLSVPVSDNGACSRQHRLLLLQLASFAFTKVTIRARSNEHITIVPSTSIACNASLAFTKVTMLTVPGGPCIQSIMQRQRRSFR